MRRNQVCYNSYPQKGEGRAHIRSKKNKTKILFLKREQQLLAKLKIREPKPKINSDYGVEKE